MYCAYDCNYIKTLMVHVVLILLSISVGSIYSFKDPLYIQQKKKKKIHNFNNIFHFLM